MAMGLNKNGVKSERHGFSDESPKPLLSTGMAFETLKALFCFIVPAKKLLLNINNFHYGYDNNLFKGDAFALCPQFTPLSQHS